MTVFTDDPANSGPQDALAPDELHKANISGGPHDVPLPDLRADPVLARQLRTLGIPLRLARVAAVRELCSMRGSVRLMPWVEPRWYFWSTTHSRMVDAGWTVHSRLTRSGTTDTSAGTANTPRRH